TPRCAADIAIGRACQRPHYRGIARFSAKIENGPRGFEELNPIEPRFSIGLTVCETEQKDAGVAQLVEHLICNQRVGGSSPSASSIQSITYSQFRDVGAGLVATLVATGFEGVKIASI